MHQKILSILVLLVYGIVAEMPVVHALEMRDMPKERAGVSMHEAHGSSSVFCAAKNSATRDESAPECLRSPTPDVVVPEKIRVEREHACEWMSPIFWTDPSERLDPSSDRDVCVMNHTERIVRPGGSYADLIGIVKRLD